MTNATDTETHHPLMLSIAKEIIECRAARDGCEPETYDAERDEEGYVVSLLNALRQWCYAYEIDWEAELERALQLFFADLGGFESPATVENLKCPACAHQGSFYVEACEVLLIFDDGVVLQDDTPERWGDSSYCSCHTCAHAGRVYQFRKDFQERKNTHG